MRFTSLRTMTVVAVSALGLVVSTPGLGAHAARAAAARWLTVNSKQHTVTFTLIAGYTNALGGLNFNGDVNGKMVLSVPVGYRVNVIFSNKSAAPHSAVFTPYAQKDNTGSYRTAFKGSATPNWTNGITAGQTEKFSFVATTAGKYALVCGVPGHEAAGMWDVLNVTRGGMAHLTL